MEILKREPHREQEAAQEQAREFLAGACERIQKLAVTKVEIAFDGCGDSGVIETVSAFDTADKVMKLPDDLVEALEKAMCGLVPVGWEVNDGSFGQLSLDVDRRTLKRPHTWRSTGQ